jgi:hypothetical protein
MTNAELARAVARIEELEAQIRAPAPPGVAVAPQEEKRNVQRNARIHV